MSWRLALFALPLAMQLAAANAIAAELQLGSTWARATPPGAASATVHRTEIVDDVARMREVAVLD